MKDCVQWNSTPLLLESLPPVEDVQHGPLDQRASFKLKHYNNAFRLIIFNTKTLLCERQVGTVCTNLLKATQP